MPFAFQVPRRWIAHHGWIGALSLASLAVIFVFRRYFGSQPLFSDDLHSHVALIERLAEQLVAGNLRFYDPLWFAGWPAFEFYPPLPHLLAALIAPLASWAQDPFQTAANVVMILGFAALPWSVFYCALPLCRDVSSSKTKRPAVRWLAALSAVTAGYWFLFSDQQVLGIGVKYVLESGVIGQPLALNLLLLVVGSWLRLGPGRNSDSSVQLRAVLCLALLCVTHLLTAVFAMLLAGLLFVWLAAWRWRLLQDVVLALFLAGFFLVPFAVYVGEYGVADTRITQRDVAGVVFDYLPLDVLNAVAAIREGVNIVTLAAWLAVLVLLFHPATRAAVRLRGLAIVTIVCALIIMGDYWAGLLPPGIHYNRLFAPVFLMAAVCLSCAPQTAPAEGRRGAAWLIGLSVVLVMLSVFAAWRIDPQIQRAHELAARGGFADEKEMLELIRSEPAQGRIALERFTDLEVFGIAPGKYLEARLSRQGIPTLNGLMLQSSRAFVFDAAALAYLGAQVFGLPSPLLRSRTGTGEQALAHLRRRGVTHLVAATRPLVRELERLGAERRGGAGPYHLFQIAERAAPVAPVQKPLVGFLDRGGAVNFRLLQYYFFRNPQLRDGFELLNVEHGAIPQQLAVVLISEAATGLAAGQGSIRGVPGRPPALRIGYRSSRVIHDYPWSNALPSDPDVRYAEIEAFLDQIGLAEYLREARTPVGEVPAVPSIEWAADDQSFRLSGLRAGVFYRLGYSYLPYWRAEDGRLFEDGRGHMVYLAGGPTANFQYERYWSHIAWVGWLCTASGALLILVVRRRRQ